METDGLFLLSEYCLGTDSVSFNYVDSLNNDWQDSEIRQVCIEFCETNFSENERSAILSTSKDDSEYTIQTQSMGEPGSNITFAARENILKDDYVFLLSVEEANNADYGFIDDAARKAFLV